MKTKCLSVRLKSLELISHKAYKATDFNGNTDIIPASQVMGVDYDVLKSEAYWITEWILDKKNITYNSKKIAWFDENSQMIPFYTIEKHCPVKIEPKNSNIIDELIK